MQTKIIIFVGALAVFQFFLGVSCDVARRQCYSCEDALKCKNQDQESMKVEICNTTTNVGLSQDYCIQHEDPQNGEVFYRGCALKAVEINGVHQIGHHTVYIRFEAEYMANRVCICKSDLCNYKTCNTVSQPKPQGQHPGVTLGVLIGYIFASLAIGFLTGCVIVIRCQ